MEQLPYGRQWVDEDDIAAVSQALRSDWLTTGPAVEAFESESFDREGETNDDELRDAARRTLTRLREENAAVGPGFPGERASGPGAARAFTFTSTGCFGAGCIIAVIWFALCLLQWAAVTAQVQKEFEWNAVPAALVGLVLAFIPIIGNLIAFFGAKDIWGWPLWIAAIVFFAAPAATMISGWSRYRRYRR